MERGKGEEGKRGKGKKRDAFMRSSRDRAFGEIEILLPRTVPARIAPAARYQFLIALIILSAEDACRSTGNGSREVRLCVQPLNLLATARAGTLTSAYIGRAGERERDGERQTEEKRERDPLAKNNGIPLISTRARDSR